MEKGEGKERKEKDKEEKAIGKKKGGKEEREDSTFCEN